MDQNNSRLHRLLVEFRRRGALRVAGIYGTVGFVLVEAADIILPALFLPAWLLTLVVAIVGVGFPVAIAIAWFYELTPEGVKRDDLPAEQKIDAPSLVPGVAFALVAVVAMGAAATFFVTSRATPLDPGRVVVSVFENQTGDESFDAVGQMAADWIARGLTRTGLIDVIPATTAFISSYYHGADAGGGPAIDPVLAVAEETGAGTVVSGTMYLVDGVLQLEARISDVATGRLLRALDPVVAPVEDLNSAIEQLQSRVVGSLASMMDPRLNRLVSQASVPPSYEAYRVYADGFEALVERDFIRAIQQFHRAHALDTAFVQPLIWAATAYWLSGRGATADSLAAVAGRQRHLLLPIEVLHIDYLRALVQGNVPLLTELARRGYDETGGDALWRYFLGSAEYVSGRPSQTLEVFSGLDPNGSLMSGWWQYWIWPLGAYHRLGRYEEELEQARVARRRYPRVPDLAFDEVMALAALGRVDELDQLFEEATPFVPDIGRLVNRASDELLVHGYTEAAESLVRRSIAWYEDDRLSNLGEVSVEYPRALMAAGRLNEAHQSLEAIVEDRPNYVAALRELGRVHALEGREGQAREIMARLAPLEVHSVSGQARPIGQAEIAANLGELDEAVGLLRQAFTNGSYHSTFYHYSRALAPLRGYEPYDRLVAPDAR